MLPVRWFALTLCLLLTPQASAYLGGFEQDDGFLPGGSLPTRDVSGYNAGEYGTGNGGSGGSFQDITANTGLFYKNDLGSISEGFGELVAQHGLAHTGESSLALRATLGFGDTGDDGANYLYSFDARDFDGVSPSLVTAGTVTLDYWMRPQTPFFSTARVTTTEFLNSTGDTIFAIGTLGQGLFTAQPFIEWYDGTTWNTTSIEANNASWDHVMLTFDLTNDLVSFSYFASLTNTTHTIATNVATGVTLDQLSGIRFTAQPNTEMNNYDDFNVVAPLVVPEPASALLVLLSVLQVFSSRRRRVCV
jgi:hypothetical protein